MRTGGAIVLKPKLSFTVDLSPLSAIHASQLETPRALQSISRILFAHALHSSLASLRLFLLLLALLALPAQLLVPSFLQLEPDFPIH